MSTSQLCDKKVKLDTYPHHWFWVLSRLLLLWQSPYLGDGVCRLEQLEIAKQFYCQAVKLAPSNMRALYGLLLTTSQLAANPKCPQVRNSIIVRPDSLFFQIRIHPSSEYCYQKDKNSHKIKGWKLFLSKFFKWKVWFNVYPKGFFKSSLRKK